MKIENINPNTYKSRGIYTPAKKIDMGEHYIVYVSGIQPQKNDKNKILTSDITEQTNQVFQEINSILQQCGGNLDNVIKAVIYLTDMNDFKQVSQIRDEYFAHAKPVSSLVEVNRMTRDGAKIEIEVTALIEK